MRPRNKIALNITADTLAVIDFDDVLFRVSALTRAMQQLVVKNGGTVEQCRAAYVATGRPYIFHRHALLIKKSNPSFRVAAYERDIAKLLRRADAFVYPDVFAFLKKLRPAKIVIATYGHRAWQKRKIDGSGLLRYVDRVTYTQQNKSMLGHLFGHHRVLYFDDNPEHVDEVKKYFPKVFAVQVSRPDAKRKDMVSVRADVRVSGLGGVRLRKI